MEVEQLAHNSNLHSDEGVMINSCNSSYPISELVSLTCAQSNHSLAGNSAHWRMLMHATDDSDLNANAFAGACKRRCVDQSHGRAENCERMANGQVGGGGDKSREAECDSISLNPSVWNSLPAELLEKVIACLPTESLFKFRAVCRAWRAAPFRPLVRSLRARMMTAETWLIMLGRPRSQARTAGIPSSVHGSCIPFVFNPQQSKASALDAVFFPFPPSHGCISYCCAAGGLICYHYHMGFSSAACETSAVSLWVGNPLVKEWKRLPPTVGCFPLNFPLRGLAGMVIEAGGSAAAPTHYKIIVRTQAWGGAGMMTEEYDSQASAWRVTTTGNVPADHRIEQVLHCSGSLYFLTWQARDGIYVYHLLQQAWSRIQPPKRYQFTSPHMVDCCGQLLLVSGIGKHRTIKRKGSAQRLHIRTTGIKIWKLSMADEQSCRVCWSALSRMPEELVQEFVTGVHFHCTCIRNIVYLTNSISLLIFNVAARIWRRIIIAQLPFLAQDLVSFEPKPEASP